MASIAFIGLGNMGGPMAANLVKAGHKVVAFDSSRPRAIRPRREGVAMPKRPIAAVKGADVVITMLPAGKHVLSVWQEVVPAKTGALLIDCSTIDVESAGRPMRWRRSRAASSMRRCRAAPAARRARH